MQNVLDTIKMADSGQISGISIATWLLQRHNPSGVRDSLKALVRRELITMKVMDDPDDEFRKRFPDYMKALYSVKK
jgi:hypothetical protein